MGTKRKKTPTQRLKDAEGVIDAMVAYADRRYKRAAKAASYFADLREKAKNKAERAQRHLQYAEASSRAHEAGTTSSLLSNLRTLYRQGNTAVVRKIAEAEN